MDIYTLLQREVVTTKTRLTYFKCVCVFEQNVFIKFSVSISRLAFIIVKHIPFSLRAQSKFLISNNPLIRFHTYKSRIQILLFSRCRNFPKPIMKIDSTESRF